MECIVISITCNYHQVFSYYKFVMKFLETVCIDALGHCGKWLSGLIIRQINGGL